MQDSCNTPGMRKPAACNKSAGRIRRRRGSLANRHGASARQAGFFVPALVLAFLVVLFIAMLFGTRLLERNAPVEIRYSERYHELNRKESLNEAESAELEVERCRFERALVKSLQPNNGSRYEHARSRYETTCQDKLPL